jgi:hypothetical protein
MEDEFLNALKQEMILTDARAAGALYAYADALKHHYQAELHKKSIYRDTKIIISDSSGEVAFQYDSINMVLNTNYGRATRDFDIWLKATRYLKSGQLSKAGKENVLCLNDENITHIRRSDK